MFTLLFLLGCNGNTGDGPGHTGSGTDDTSVETTFSARLEINLPSNTASDEVEVSVDGEAVPRCDAETYSCYYDVQEPDTYSVEAEAEAMYFAPLTVPVTEEDDGGMLSTAWTIGGCGDSAWEVGDGVCPNWTNGQVGCNFSGSWQGIEEEVWDIDLDLGMIAKDVDDDGITDAVISGGSPFGDTMNVSGTAFYKANDEGQFAAGEALKEIGDGTYEKASCTDFDAFSVVTNDGSTDHFRRVSN